MTADDPADPVDPAEPTDGTPTDGTPDGTDQTPAPLLLRVPRDGLPAVVTTAEALAAVAAGLAAGEGPVAVDAERASGYRYSQRAYLVQLRRNGFGTALIDPIAVGDLSPVGDALTGVEWILHAANQDLPCLDEIGMRPTMLFDTELAGRLLGFERVALGTMVEQYLGMALEKGHSAADWSTRPLPEDWLNYAALDVELLVDLRQALVDALGAAGKLEWAEQEFEHIRTMPPPPPRVDPWRRVSGLHAIRNRRQLALVRALWQARDSLASSRDIAPGRVLPDSAIIAAAKASPRTATDLAALPVYGGPRQRRQSRYWLEALAAGRDVPDADLPQHSATAVDPDQMPPQSRWRDRDPAAAIRLAASRDVVSAVAEQNTVLAQNLLAGDVVRRLCWRPPAPTPDAVAGRLTELGARPWQVALLAAPLATTLADAAERASAQPAEHADEPAQGA